MLLFVSPCVPKWTHNNHKKGHRLQNCLCSLLLKGKGSSKVWTVPITATKSVKKSRKDGSDLQCCSSSTLHTLTCCVESSPADVTMCSCSDERRHQKSIRIIRKLKCSYFKSSLVSSCSLIFYLAYIYFILFFYYQKIKRLMTIMLHV